MVRAGRLVEVTRHIYLSESSQFHQPRPESEMEGQPQASRVIQSFNFDAGFWYSYALEQGFLDPITGRVMENPQTIIMTGEAYDLSTVEQALARRDDWRNPNGPDYVPNPSMRSVIELAIQTGHYQPIAAYPQLEIGGLNTPLPDKKLW
jgi:hypothetical protein